MTPEELSEYLLDKLEAYMRDLVGAEAKEAERLWTTQCPQCLKWYVLGTQHQCETKLLGPGTVKK